MNKQERAVILAAVENIFAGTERKEKEELAFFRARMETSAKDGCHTIMRLLESDEANKTIILNTLLWLEDNDMLNDDWTMSEIVDQLKNDKFTGD